MTEEPEERHPSDVKAERLQGQLSRQTSFLKSLLDRPPSPARDSAERVTREEIARVERELYALDYSDPDAQPITHTPIEPRLPLLPGPPSWRTSPRTVTPHGSERPSSEPKWRDEADAIIARAIEKALSDLTTNPRAEPPRLTAMQVYDHHVARGERLPDSALELLARAMRIDPRSVTALLRRAAILRADEAGRSAKEISDDLGIGTRAVRLTRNRPVPVNVALFAAVAESKDLRALRPAVAAALGLLGEDGRWRPQVIRELTSLPERVEPALVGILADGRFYGPEDDLPDTAVDAEFVWQDRVIPSSGGILEPDLVREAARTEAQRRWDGQPENDANEVAFAVSRKCRTNVDPRKVRRWMDRPDWERAAQSHLTWLRRKDEEGFRAATVTEALRRLKHEKDSEALAKISNDADAIACARADATGQPFQVETAQRWMERPAWESAVAVQMDRLREEKRKTELRLLQRGIPTQTSS